MPHSRQPNLAEASYRIFVPEEYLKCFDVNHIENHSSEWVIELVERPDLIPAALQGKDVVFDGYANGIDILTHAFSLKKIYLRLFRRRWKERGTTKHYSNEYDLHIPGMKTTKEFGDFLNPNFAVESS